MIPSKQCYCDNCNGAYESKALKYVKLLTSEPYIIELSLQDYQNYSGSDKQQYCEVTETSCNVCGDSYSSRINQFIRATYSQVSNET